MHQALITLLSVSVGLALGSHAFGQSVDERLEPARGALDISPPFQAESVADLDEPWAMTFLPDGRMLVTEKRGSLHVVTQDGQVSRAIAGVPPVDYGGQGGLGDVALHPDFADNEWVYLTWAEAGEGDTRGAAMGRGRLDLNALTLDEFEVLWRQTPKVAQDNHYSHRMAFSPDGQHVFVTSGDRWIPETAQDTSNNLGAVLRLTLDGRAAPGNPMYDRGGVAAEIWSWGHRSPLGLAFDAEGTLWEIEMGPTGGDEFQRIESGRNYGWPIVAYGDHYGGPGIPGHDTRPEFRAPDTYWNPVISPSSMIIYSGTLFSEWQGQALITGLTSRSLVRVSFDCPLVFRDVCEVERYPMGNRLRELEQGPDGAIWLLEDGGQENAGRLLRLTPRRSRIHSDRTASRIPCPPSLELRVCGHNGRRNHMSRNAASALALAMMLPSSLHAQAQTLREYHVAAVEKLRSKFVALAGAIAEERYDWRL